MTHPRMPKLFALLLLVLLPLAAFAAPAPALVEGQDYVLIENGQPWRPLDGKVEVVEVFGYTCPHCAHFQPKVSVWARKNAKTVNFIPMAAPFGGSWQPYAQAYYAALKSRFKVEIRPSALPAGSSDAASAPAVAASAR